MEIFSPPFHPVKTRNPKTAWRMRMTWSSPQVGILIVEDSQPTISSDISSDINCENKSRHNDSQDMLLSNATLLIIWLSPYNINRKSRQPESWIALPSESACVVCRLRMGKSSSAELISRNRKEAGCGVNRVFNEASK